MQGPSRTAICGPGACEPPGLAQPEKPSLAQCSEGSGEDIERLWQLAAECGLPFERKGIVHDVLTRGHINDEIENRMMLDEIVIQAQMGKILAAEVQR